MEMWQVPILYKNSFMKYSKTIQIKIRDKDVDVHRYLLDKRFVKLSLEDLKSVFEKCKIKEDDYWFIIYSAIYLNNDYVFNNLSSQGFIVSPKDFIEIVG